MLVFLLCLFLTINIISSFNSNDFVNEDIKRKIDLKNNIIYIENEIKVNANRDEDTYRYVIPKNNTYSLIRISAKSSRNQQLKIEKIIGDSNYDYYEVKLQGSNQFTVYEDYFEKLQFKPKNIGLKEEQLELFKDTVNMVSAYLTKKQTTTVYLPKEGTRLVKYTMKDSNRSGDKIIYSLTNQYPPLTSKNLYIHYENNEPLRVMNYAIKTFQVSHWGNIAVKEEYQLENIGAKLIGEFGRVDYDDYGSRGGKNALKSISATLPLRSWGLWYRDEIGNISTSNAKREWNNVALTLFPRFPILGGWKSNYDIGYNLPSKFHVTTNQQGNYMVNLTFGMPYKDMLAKNYTVKVILPESADNIKVNLPINAHYEISYDKEYGCLDLFGRKSIIITLNNMYDVYNTNFFISYDYQWTMLFVKPIILIIYFLILFTIMIIYSRANISLSRKTEEGLKEKLD